MCCHGYQHIIDLYNLDNDEFDEMEYRLNVVSENYKILSKTLVKVAIYGNTLYKRIQFHS